MTEKGRKVAEDVIFRHKTLKQFFVEVLALDEEISEEGACRIEHAAPPEIIERMINFIEFMQNCPRGGEDLIKGFSDYCAQGKTRVDCEECVSNCLHQSFPKA